jgi:Nuclear condensing complex subunits, C-term domain
VFRLAEDLEDEEEMVSPSQIALQLVDWTDPRRLVDLGQAASAEFDLVEEETTMKNSSIHVDLATDIMTSMQKASSITPLANF